MDPVAVYVVQTCFLADRANLPPSAIHQGVRYAEAKWNAKDRALMLAYHQVVTEIQNEEYAKYT